MIKRTCHIRRPVGLPGERGWLPVLLLLTCLGHPTPAATNSVLSKTPPIQLRPYRVCVSVAFGDDGRYSTRFRKAVFDDFRNAATRSLGQMWTLTLEDNLWLYPISADGLQRLGPDAVKQHATRLIKVPSIAVTSDSASDAAKPEREARPVPTIVFDKVYVVVIQAIGGGHRIEGIEWDRASGSLSIPRHATTYVTSSLGADCFAIVHRLFRPVAEIDRVEDDVAIVRLQAGEFLPADPTAAQMQQKAVLQPMFRYLDKTRAARSIQMVPWTYLTVSDIDRGRLTCSITSGVGSPLGGKKRRRVESMAIAQRPVLSGTRLTLLPQRLPGKPLIGYHVTSVPGPPPKRVAVKTEDKDSKTPPPRMRQFLSDRSGEVTIPVDPEQLIVTLYIRSGKTVLARVPFVPGVEQTSRIALPDDSLRLTVEGQIEVFNSKLIDTIARKTVLLAVAQKAADKGNADLVNEQIAALRTLPDRKYFEKQLQSIRFPAIKAAQQRGDGRAETRIKKICADTEGIIQRHLNPLGLRDSIEELQQRLRDNAAQ